MKDDENVKVKWRGYEWWGPILEMMMNDENMRAKVVGWSLG